MSYSSFASAGGAAAAASTAGGAAASGGLGSFLSSAAGGPVGLALGGVQFGLGLLTNSANNKAKREDYLNQTAFQDATTQFNSWQAGMNAERSDLNQQYKYWGDTVRYNQNFSYTQQLRAVEYAKEAEQAELVFNTRASAAADYSNQSSTLAAQMQERAMSEAVAVQQYRYRALQSSAAYQAAGQAGNSMDRFVRNFDRQAGDYAALKQIEAGLRENQYTRAQQSQVATYLSRYNSQQFYMRQPYMDPIAPFAPLPTLVTPAGPTMRGAAPSSNSFLNSTTAALGGLNTALSFGSSVNKLREG